METLAVAKREPLIKVPVERARFAATLKDEMNHPEIVTIGCHETGASLWCLTHPRRTGYDFQISPIGWVRRQALWSGHGPGMTMTEKRNHDEGAGAEFGGREAERVKASQDVFSEALRQHRAGQLAAADSLYRRVLKADPRHAAAFHHLGIIALQTGRLENALDLFGQAIAIDGRIAEYHYYIGLACGMLGKLEEAEAHNRQAIELQPGLADAHLNLGNALKGQGRPDEAMSCYERVLALKPNSPEAHYNLANVLSDQGRFDAAVAHYRQALLLRPDYADAHNNLGTALASAGDTSGAVAHYQHALTLEPTLFDTYVNLVTALLADGNVGAAIKTVAHALTIKETLSLRSLFVQCVRASSAIPPEGEFRGLVVRAVEESWGTPSDLGAFVTILLKAEKTIGPMIERAMAIWPRRLPTKDLFAEPVLSELTGSRLLLSMLRSTPVTDIAFERFLTGARRAMLEIASQADATTAFDPQVLRLCAALAEQCFINEYVFDRLEEEAQHAERLREAVVAAVTSGVVAPAPWLVAVAAYFPLHSLSCANNLLDRQWPAPVAALLVQQVREPEEEAQIRASIPALTAIEDSVSLEVRQQYEENPYPRWAGKPPEIAPVTFDDYVRGQFPLAPFQSFGRRDLDYLIAGCGTGRHSIAVAQMYAGIRLLAIDLSLSSIAYAARKTRALGLSNIAYAQADILKLGGIGRSFDVIDSTGVLHHMGDPWQGWRVLLSLLKPGGCMRIGLYSELARRDVAKTMEFIAVRGYGRTASDIQKCRQELADFPDGTPQKNVTRVQDFYSTSDCRDWIFHVQQHGTTIPEIKAFLADNDLRFLGFELPARATRIYSEWFPEDKSRTDLDRWHLFEVENPDAFADMYVFLLQRRH